MTRIVEASVDRQQLPRVCVLLATFNGVRYLEDQMRSLSEQRGVDLKIVACDDGSTDGTVEQLMRCVDLFDLRLEMLRGQNPTGSAARNFFRLIALADFDDFDYVALCDQDDIWCDTRLERACSVLRQASSAAYSSDTIAFWPDGSRKPIRKGYRQRDLDYLLESGSQGCTYVLTAATARLFQRFIRERTGFLGTILFHDWLLYAWARKNGLSWYMDDSAGILYRQSNSNVIGANSGLAAIRKRIGLLSKRWFSAQSVAIAEAIGIPDHPIVKRLRRLRFDDRVYIALHCRSLRRRPRDQFTLAISCLIWGV